MKKLLIFVILYSLFFILLCPNTKAQWEGAQVQRLTFNNSVNKIKGLYIDQNDKLVLFYQQWKWNPEVQPYRDSLFIMTKAKGAEWSQPEKIGYPPFDEWGFDKYVGYDIKSGITHIFYSTYAGNILYYTNSNVPGWQPVKIDSLSEEQNAEYHSLAMGFDTLGNIHLAWHVDFDSIGYDWYRVMYANNSTGEWVKQQVSPPIFLGGMGSGPTKFSVQKNGAAHILYQEEPYCDLECNGFYVRNDSLNSTHWITDTLPKPSRPLWYYGGYFINVDVNDRIHLITVGCIEEECIWNGSSRGFYYYKDSQDSLWIGPELILDSLFDLSEEFIDHQSIPYAIEWSPYTYCRYFTDRKQGFWREPYQILDTTSMCNDLSSIYQSGFSFVLDSKVQGHGVFAGSLRLFMSQLDSLEIYYFGPPLSSVDDPLQEQRNFGFELFQNYPNPFNLNTVIHYSSHVNHSVPIRLKIYNILGEEVRELVNTRQSRGDYQVNWDGKDNSGKEVSSGIYFYQLWAGAYQETKKLVLVK